MPHNREHTEKLLQAVEEGILDHYQVILACVKFMSEDQVAAMCAANDFFPQDEEEVEDEAEDMLNDFNWVGSRHHY